MQRKVISSSTSLPSFMPERKEHRSCRSHGPSCHYSGVCYPAHRTHMGGMFLAFGIRERPHNSRAEGVRTDTFHKRSDYTSCHQDIHHIFAMQRCCAALELLRLCTNALEAVEQVFVTPVEKWLDKSLCWRPIQTNAQLNPCLWQELALLRATILEIRAKLN